MDQQHRPQLFDDWTTEHDRRLQRLTERYLASGGRIVVGGIAFPTSGARDRAHRKWMKLWDEDEHHARNNDVSAAAR